MGSELELLNAAVTAAWALAVARHGITVDVRPAAELLPTSVGPWLEGLIDPIPLDATTAERLAEDVDAAVGELAADGVKRILLKSGYPCARICNHCPSAIWVACFTVAKAA